MRIAVLGAGLAGACTALELAARGCLVDLFEARGEIISQASFWNEGKIHLGFVYGKDLPGRTALTMMRGALQFRPHVCRWMSEQAFQAALSEPFIYAVMKDSMMPAERLERHYAFVENAYADEMAKPGSAYLTRETECVWRRMSQSQTAGMFDVERVTAAYRTAERSVDPQVVAAHLRRAVHCAPNIRVRTGTRVVGVSKGKSTSLIVGFAGPDGTERDAYTSVVNALWQNRLGIDATFGVYSGRNIVHRYKLSLHSHRSRPAATVPTVTFVLGPYGDTVNFGDRTYLSWYPAGVPLISRQTVPPLDPAQSPTWDDDLVVARTLDSLAELLPACAAALREHPERWRVEGGYISAWGSSDIDDADSELHDRYQVGVESHGTYHSLNTGKYTLAPYFAEQVCDRIVPRTRVYPVSLNRLARHTEL